MPTNFFWLTDRRIAGMERPGSVRPIEEDLAFLGRQGIGIVISLTVEPLLLPPEANGLELFHIPVPDGTAPTLPQIESFVAYVNYGLSGGKRILVHCGAGLGRTGTMFACYLVHLGYTAPEAMREVRRRSPRAIENSAQEERVREWERSRRERGAAEEERT
ncbi:MAG: dual specificity protein phosphatase family protein [bacterium]|nr:dual specificity protein phosphatase family protein [bacterium]